MKNTFIVSSGFSEILKKLLSFHLALVVIVYFVSVNELKNNSANSCNKDNNSYI